MAQATKISWTETTWNPVAGCSVISPGCTNCYAMQMAHRIKHIPAYAGTTKVVNGNPVWTGKINLVDKVLDFPRKWKKPRMIFVNSMSDLFHEDVPDDYIVRIFEVMADCPQHTFQILTKRADRMRSFTSDLVLPNTLASTPPLPNVWLGVSIENLNEMENRLDDLLETLAAKRFISFEPLLEDVAGELHFRSEAASPWFNGEDIHWIIIGGESGPRARPMQPEWATSLIDYCTSLDTPIPVWFKQMGGRGKDKGGDLLDGERIQEYPK